MNCKICNSCSNFLFDRIYLCKYKVSLFQCSNCGFLQTEKPYWLEEAYEKPFTPLDVFIVSRPIEQSQVTENIILNYFNYKSKFLDFGGGIGVFTRLMRDRGLDFYRQDKFAQNLFVQHFDISDLSVNDTEFELVTSFEVLEHFEFPMEEFEQMFSYGRSVLCSTGLQPESFEELRNWEYLGELHGQHISFFTRKSMEIIADKFDCFYYTESGYHLFTPQKLSLFKVDRLNLNHRSIAYRIKRRLVNLIEKTYKVLYGNDDHPLSSLMMKDYNMIKEELKKKEVSN